MLPDSKYNHFFSFLQNKQSIERSDNQTDYYIRQMYLERLKHKYKEILNTSKDQNINNRTVASHSFSTKHNTRALTQYTDNTSKGNTLVTSNYVLGLKQRIAQSIQNLQLKEREIATLKEEMVRKDEQIRILQQQINQHKAATQEQEQRVVQAKVVSANLEGQIQKFKEQLQALNIDKQLALKQSEYYKHEASKISKEKNHQTKVIDSFQKNMRELEDAKNQNYRLRDDIKRLQTIVKEMCQQRLKTDVTDKHYLGKPLKEASMWFSQNLVGEVQHFLKKEQMGQGNNKFLNNLVKFISKYTASVGKSKVVSSQNSRIKSAGFVSHCRSASVYDPGYTSIYDLGTCLIKKNQNSVTSALKKSLMVHKYKKIDSRKYTPDSFLLSEQGTDSSTCEQILKEYKSMLKEVLQAKPVKAKTILDLSEEMSSAVLHALEQEGK